MWRSSGRRIEVDRYTSGAGPRTLQAPWPASRDDARLRGERSWQLLAASRREESLDILRTAPRNP